jgi:hypothetical protein
MNGSPRRLICATIVAIVSGLGRPGYADLEYHLLASGAAGASDNPRMQPDTAQPGTSAPRADGFVSAQGQIELDHIGRLTQERLSYGIMGLSWFRGSLGSSVTHNLKLSSDIQAGPATKLTLGAGAMLAQLTTIDTTAPTDTQTTGPRPAGDQKFVGVDVGEVLASEIGGSWRVDQTLQGRLYRPLGNNLVTTENRGATFMAGLHHLWARDGVGLRTQLGFMTSDTSTVSAPSGQSETVTLTSELAELSLSWQRDWTPEFHHAVTAGAFILHTDSSRVLPAGSASLLWHRTGYDVEIRGTSSADSNIYVGAAFRRSLVGLRVALPLDRLEQLRVTVDADVEHDSTVGASSSASGSANVALAHAALSWRPGDMFVFGLEYTFRDQRGSQTDTGTSPSPTTSSFPTFRGQTAMFTVGVRYPPSGMR